MVLSAFVTFMISLIVLVVVIAFFNIINVNPIHITWRIVYCVIPIMILFVLSLGVGMILATLSVFFRDVENLYDVVCLASVLCNPDRLYY